MKYNFNNRVVNIPDSQIEKLMKNLDLTKEEAIATWLDDNDFTSNDEQNSLNKTASKVKIQHGASSGTRKTTKSHISKTSDEKKEVFATIYNNLKSVYGDGAKLEKDNKLILVTLGEKIIKIDVIEQRPKK